MSHSTHPWVGHLLMMDYCYLWVFPGNSVGKNLPANEEDEGLISGMGRSPGEANATPLHYSYLGDHMDRGAWWATVHGVAKSQT